MKLLFLGGAPSQVPIIEEAKQRGHYIITCDYLPDNPGHKLADEYHNISTIDKELVLKLAKNLKIDHIIAYASDIAVQTAAFVSQEMGLPYNSYQSVKLLTEKDLFRDLLMKNRFNCPKFISVSSLEELQAKSTELSYPFIVKPTDSAGSKGVRKVEKHADLEEAFDYAKAFSRNGRVIAEEFINNSIADLHGDGFVVNGELIFLCLGDHVFSSKKYPFNPNGTTWPSSVANRYVSKIEKDIKQIIKKSGFRDGPINVEARVNQEGNDYIMEIGPRSGGHFVPQAIYHATGFNMVSAMIDLVEGKEVIKPNNKNKYSSYLSLFSEKGGKFSRISISEEFNTFIKERYIYVNAGDKIFDYKNASAAIGILIFSFEKLEEFKYFKTNITNVVNIVLEDE